VRGLLLRLLQFKFTITVAPAPLLSSLAQHEKKGCCCNRFFVVFCRVGCGHAATHAMNRASMMAGDLSSHCASFEVA
jgi:hypothetical protein